MIHRVPATGSTNADLIARLASGELLAEGGWLVADRQTAGRGRLGRAWFDGAGNFMGSTVVHCRKGDPAPGTLALVAGLAAHEAIAPLVAPPQRALLKWPNDVMIGAAKVCGILVESVGHAVVVGFGVNLAAAPAVPDRATIALSAFGPAPDRDWFAEIVASCFAREVERWRNFGLEPLIRRWLIAGHPAGTQLEIGEQREAVLSGSFAGLAGDGALQLRLPDGTTQLIHAGEVRLAP